MTVLVWTHLVVLRIKKVSAALTSQTRITKQAEFDLILDDGHSADGDESLRRQQHRRPGAQRLRHVGDGRVDVDLIHQLRVPVVVEWALKTTQLDTCPGSHLTKTPGVEDPRSRSAANGKRLTTQLMFLWEMDTGVQLTRMQ